MIKKKDRYIVAIVGATGIRGRELLEVLEEREFPAGDLVLLASERSAGERLDFLKRKWTVKELEKDAFQDVDLTFFLAGGEQSRTFAPAAVAAGAVVIDCTGAFDEDRKVPLVNPDVNADAAGAHAGIVACPSARAIAVTTALQPLHAAATVRRVVITTFEPVSGAGKPAMDELAGQTVALLNFRDVERAVFPYQIAFNCLPLIGPVGDDGTTGEEARLAGETRRVLNADDLQVAVTGVRVPVFRGLGASIVIETERHLDPEEARALLAAAPGVVVFDDAARDIYPVQVDAVGKDGVYVGRVRKDGSVKHGLSIWITCDDLRKGSVLTAARIAEQLLRQ